MKRVLLHVGAHKTGSTSIQKTLNHFREPLAQQGVALYAGSNHTQFYRAFSDCIESFHQFYRGWRGKARQAESRREIKAHFQLSSANTHLVSAEDISLLSEQGLHNLNHFLRRECGVDEVVVVCLLREPLDYLNSSIQQFIKPGLTTLDDILKDNFGSYALQGCPGFAGGARNILAQLYFPIAAKLCNVFGAGGVRFLRFEDAIGRGLTRSLLACLPGEADFSWLEELRFNDAISHEASLLLAEYNNRHPLLLQGRKLNKQRNRDKRVVPVLKGLPGRRSNLLDARGFDLEWLNGEVAQVNHLAGFSVMTPLEAIPEKYAAPVDFTFSRDTVEALERLVPQATLAEAVAADGAVTPAGLTAINRTLERRLRRWGWLRR